MILKATKCLKLLGGESKTVLLSDGSNRTGLGSVRGWILHRDWSRPQTTGQLSLSPLWIYFKSLNLQGTVEKQREQIRDLDSELSNVKADLEDLKGQNDRLSTSNKVRQYQTIFAKKKIMNNLKWNILGATKKAAAKPKSASLPRRRKSRASGICSV